MYSSTLPTREYVLEYSGYSRVLYSAYSRVRNSARDIFSTTDSAKIELEKQQPSAANAAASATDNNSTTCRHTRRRPMRVLLVRRVESAGERAERACEREQADTPVPSQAERCMQAGQLAGSGLAPL